MPSLALSMDTHMHATRLAISIVLLLGAVSLADHADARTGSNTASTDFAATHAQWVETRARELAKPDGWISLIGLHWIDPGESSVGSSPTRTIRLGIGPARLGTVSLHDGTVRFRPAPDASISLDGTPLREEVILQPEARAAGTQLVYDGGKGRISLVVRGERLALRVRHADAPARIGFHGLEFFPADPAWQVRARFVAHPPGHTLPVVNLIGNLSDSPNPGYFEFEQEGRSWRLEALGDPASGLNLMFQDATSGKETYAVGRYLHVDAVATDGTALLDFNRAYNPPCAYTDYATCPVPPPENRLAQKDATGNIVRLAVRAGEKSYVRAH